MLLIPLKNRRYDDQPMASSQLSEKDAGCSCFSAFCKLSPGMFLSCAESKWHCPGFLKADNVGSCPGSCLDHTTHPFMKSRNLVLDQSNCHLSWRPCLLVSSIHTPALKLKVICPCSILCILTDVQCQCWFSIQNPSNLSKVWLRYVSLQDLINAGQLRSHTLLRFDGFC